MKFRVRSLAVLALLVTLTAALYTPRLDDTPIHLTPDEVFSALTAHSVASTGRDLNGRLLPLYFQLPKPFVTRMWYQPMLMYAITVSLKLRPFSEGTIRLPMTLAAVLNVVLMYAIALVLFESDLLALAAALLLALTPAHFMNSRVAMDFHAPLPFILGWLLCLLIYLRRNKPLLLFAGGALLGIGLYTYIASYLFMPAYLLMTAAVLYRRREALSRYIVLAAGFLVPGLMWVPFLLTHPTLLSDTLWRYERDRPRADTLTLTRGFFSTERLTSALSLYRGFFNPMFLFINGPRMTWNAGVFLIVVAGLLPLGIIRSVRERHVIGLVLTLGLLLAPLPASIVDEPQAIHRAGVGLPFAVLLAVMGLDYLRTAESVRSTGLIFLTIWLVVIGVATTYHDALPSAQAIVRAATIPLAAMGLAVFLPSVARGDRAIGAMVIASAFVVVLTHVVYFVTNVATIASIIVLAALGLAIIHEPSADFLRRRPRAGIGLLAFIVANFLYVYVDYGQVHRWGPVPASAMVLMLRMTFSLLAIGIVITVIRFLKRGPIDRLQTEQLAWVAAAGVLVAEVAYFGIDFFIDYRMRTVQATLVLGAAMALALVVGAGADARVKRWQIAVIAVLVLASIQFTTFYRGYFRGPFARQNAEDESKARVAFEMAIQRADQRDVPAIYLGKIGPYAVGELYWDFYLVKHHREDLRAKTIPDLAFIPDRIRMLPAGAIVITSQSPEVDSRIDAMMASGELKSRELLKAADGTPTFWILETAS